MREGVGIRERALRGMVLDGTMGQDGRHAGDGYVWSGTGPNFVFGSFKKEIDRFFDIETMAFGRTTTGGATKDGHFDGWIVVEIGL